MWSGLQCSLCTTALHPDKVREQLLKPPGANVYFRSDYISIHSLMESLFQGVLRKLQLGCIKCVKNLILSLKRETRLQFWFLARFPDWFFFSRFCFYHAFVLVRFPAKRRRSTFLLYWCGIRPENSVSTNVFLTGFHVWPSALGQSVICEQS